jgi:ankyrin repeat protein
MDRSGRLQLHYAALEGNAIQVAHLLAEGENPDAADEQGFTPLHFAAQEYHVEAARALLDGGAHVDVVNVFGNTPLWTAVFNSNGRGDLISLLLNRGANPFHLNEAGRTPVDLARLIGNSDVTQYFEGLPE